MTYFSQNRYPIWMFYCNFKPYSSFTVCNPESKRFYNSMHFLLNKRILGIYYKPSNLCGNSWNEQCSCWESTVIPRNLSSVPWKHDVSVAILNNDFTLQNITANNNSLLIYSSQMSYFLSRSNFLAIPLSSILGRFEVMFWKVWNI